MQNPAAFSIASTTMTPGFISAGTHLRNITEDKLNRCPPEPAGPPSKRIKGGSLGTSDNTAPSKGGTGKGSKGAVQGSSKSNLTQKGAAVTSNEPRATRSTRGTQIPPKGQIEILDLTFDQDDQENKLQLPPPTAAVRSTSQASPYPFTTGHRLRTDARMAPPALTALEDEPKPKPYPFLSSSPQRL